MISEKYYVHPECRKSINIINHKGLLNVGVTELKNLKTLCDDDFTKMKINELESLISTNDLKKIKSYLNTPKSIHSAIRWACRGLSVDLAIEKERLKSDFSEQINMISEKIYSQLKLSEVKTNDECLRYISNLNSKSFFKISPTELHELMIGVDENSKSRDIFSSMKLEELSNLVDKSDLEKINTHLSEEKHILNALRWRCRGLDINLSIVKTYVYHKFKRNETTLSNYKKNSKVLKNTSESSLELFNSAKKVLNKNNINDLKVVVNNLSNEMKRQSGETFYNYIIRLMASNIIKKINLINGVNKSLNSDLLIFQALINEDMLVPQSYGFRDDSGNEIGYLNYKDIISEDTIKGFILYCEYRNIKFKFEFE